MSNFDEGANSADYAEIRGHAEMRLADVEALGDGAYDSDEFAHAVKSLARDVLTLLEGRPTLPSQNDESDHYYRPVQTIEGICCGYCKGPEASPRHHRAAPSPPTEESL